MLRVTVYASSSENIPARYFAAAQALGRGIGKRGWTLVFGGGRYGLMGAVSRAAREAGAEIEGIILQDFIDKNVHCTETLPMHSVTDMRSRKRGLAEAGDAYVALPGGHGTMEELMEMISFKQLGFHDRPIVVLNVGDYYRPLLQMIDRGFEQGFIHPQFADLFQVASTPKEALALLDQEAGSERPERPDRPDKYDWVKPDAESPDSESPNPESLDG